jgi:hypothetical protein
MEASILSYEADEVLGTMGADKLNLGMLCAMYVGTCP